MSSPLVAPLLLGLPDDLSVQPGYLEDWVTELAEANAPAAEPSGRLPPVDTPQGAPASSSSSVTRQQAQGCTAGRKPGGMQESDGMAAHDRVQGRKQPAGTQGKGGAAVTRADQRPDDSSHSTGTDQPPRDGSPATGRDQPRDGSSPAAGAAIQAGSSSPSSHEAATCASLSSSSPGASTDAASSSPGSTNGARHGVPPGALPTPAAASGATASGGGSGGGAGRKLGSAGAPPGAGPTPTAPLPPEVLATLSVLLLGGWAALQELHEGEGHMAADMAGQLFGGGSKRFQRLCIACCRNWQLVRVGFASKVMASVFGAVCRRGV